MKNYTSISALTFLLIAFLVIIDTTRGDLVYQPCDNYKDYHPCYCEFEHKSGPNVKCDYKEVRNEIPQVVDWSVYKHLYRYPLGDRTFGLGIEMRIYCPSFFNHAKVFGLLALQNLNPFRDSGCPSKDILAPCICKYQYDGNLAFYTGNITSLQQVQKVFKNVIDRNLRSLRLNVPPSVDVIPEDLLQGKRVESIILTCPSSDYQLKVDKNAFISTKSYTTRFEINGCDMSQLSFDFLEGFNNLAELKIIYSTKFQESGFSNLPPLPSLQVLDIKYSSDLNALTRFPNLANGLHRLIMQSNQLNDATAELVLNSVLPSSKNTLQTLVFSSNSLTKIPSQIPKFSQTLFQNSNVDSIYPYTHGYDFSSNSISLIPSGTFSSLGLSHCRNCSSRISLQQNQIVIVEPGAFQGEFEFINLEENKLTRLESPVFKTLLSQVKSQYLNMGKVALQNNPINCESDHCHLAWLIRDNRKLLNSIDHGTKCSSGTDLKNLKPDGFKQC